MWAPLPLHLCISSLRSGLTLSCCDNAIIVIHGVLTVKFKLNVSRTSQRLPLFKNQHITQEAWNKKHIIFRKTSTVINIPESMEKVSKYLHMPTE